MKIFTLVACLVLAGCSVAREPEITTVLAFPDETYAVNGAPLTLVALRPTLGAGCYRTGYRAIARLMSSLRNAGYSRIALATVPSHPNA